MFVGKSDVAYDRSIRQKTDRENRAQRIVSNNTTRILTTEDNKNLGENIFNEVVSDSVCDDNFYWHSREEKKSDIVFLDMPRKRLSNVTVLTDKRFKMEILAHRDTLANINNVGWRIVMDFTLSNKTIRKAGTSEVKKWAFDIRKSFKNIFIENHNG